MTDLLIDEDNEVLEILINGRKVTTIIDKNFESTIANLRGRLDEYTTNIGLKEEIIYNVSKHFGQTYRSNDNTKTTDDNPNNHELASTIVQSISSAEWQKMVLRKYLELRTNVEAIMPELWKPIEFALSVKSILSIQDCTLPFIGIILGPPSSVKTVTIELFRGSGHTFYTDNFSPKSFVSHNTTVARDKLSNVDLLPKIKNKFFLTPELSPTFSKRYEELIEILGIITRIADGHGYESDTGAQGHRGYSGEYMFTWIGAAVDIPHKVHKLFGTLGPKLYFIRLNNKKNVSEQKYLEKIKNADRFKENINQIRAVLDDYLEWFNIHPCNTCTEKEIISKTKDSEINIDQNTLVKIKWDSDSDSDHALVCIVRLAKLLAHFRGVIPTWETRDTQGSDYAYTFATIEEPERAITQLKNLARGHALSQGRNFITMNDIPLIVNVVLSTASRERVKVFEHLLTNNGLTDTSRILEDLKTTRPTALRTMTEFVALEIVDKIVLGEDKPRFYGDYEEIDEGCDIKSNSLIQIKLKPEFEWFLTNEFKTLLNSDWNKTSYENITPHIEKDNALDTEEYQHIKSDNA